jgi:tetratricopeptide (TPR) repeat protein
MNDEPNPSGPAVGGKHADTRDDLSEALEGLVAMAPLRNSSRAVENANLKPSNTGPCPDLGDWFRLTTGATATAEKDALLSHASLCSACLARLRGCQRVLSSDSSPDESKEMANFAALTPQWQHRLAVELAHTPYKTKRGVMPRLYVWATAAVVALLMIAIGTIVWWQHANAPETLLAKAYSTSRTFDLRVAGAAFAPVGDGTHLRGETTGRESAPLLSARAQIERKLEHNPSDPHYLQLQARADILGERYDAAIDILDRLLATAPVTPSMLTDDGSAYFLRGSATGSENDRATALDYLRRADELAPNDPVVLFNEALVMEDRGQVMNAVETWNRYLKFEVDPKWLEEGRQRLKSLEDKLNQMKSHESRMEQHLASPRSMRALAADPATLVGIDEELSTTMLPTLLDAAFPLPVDRSRGSPCDEKCLAARSLLRSLASSLESHHQDPWLTQFLPSDFSHTNDHFSQAAHTLSHAIDEDNRGEYHAAEDLSLEARGLFDEFGNAAGADRADVERVYSMARSFTFAPCHQIIQELLPKLRNFAWMEIQTLTVDATCDMSPGSGTLNNPIFAKTVHLAQAHRYVLLELRARNTVGGLAAEAGDTETVWRNNMETLRAFYEGDYPPFRAATTMSGFALLEDSTPRLHLDLLVNEEALALFSLSQNRASEAWQRTSVIRAAIRAGSLQEARRQIALSEKETSLGPQQKGLRGPQAEAEVDMANLYLDRGDLKSAAEMLDAAHNHMVGEDNSFQLRNYAVARGELELAQGHPDRSESMLRKTILQEESEAKDAGRENISYARRDRDLYAALAAIWLAQGRPGVDILALWERYRLRILGETVPACPGVRLDCLVPQVERSLDHVLRPASGDLLVGQIALRDRILLYRADGRNVVWKQNPLRRDDLLRSSATLERVTSTPSTSQAVVDQAARRLGDMMFGDLRAPSASNSILMLEPDPLLGNVPWPAVETASGSIGLHFNVEEAPTVLERDHTFTEGIQGRPLIVGASAVGGDHELLPEVLREARTVAGVEAHSTTLLAGDATEAKVAAHLASAPLIHFAGHAMLYGDSTRLLLAPAGGAGDKPYLDRAMFLKDPPKAARLVVFSACATGKREEGWDHGMGDIVDTLASLGVPEVVATRWQIDSASAVPMMSTFYRGLAGGLRVPQALTAARLSLIRDARYRHPYYWAAYYASGVGTTDLREVFHGDSK